MGIVTTLVLSEELVEAADRCEQSFKQEHGKGQHMLMNHDLGRFEGFLRCKKEGKACQNIVLEY
ncbi:MAG: hypothetical protein GTO13_22730 [Proteobacteria bacterium]|nr:hypothetical protein [Pseudomonadota bacterium]